MKIGLVAIGLDVVLPDLVPAVLVQGVNVSRTGSYVDVVTPDLRRGKDSAAGIELPQNLRAITRQTKREKGPDQQCQRLQPFKRVSSQEAHDCVYVKSPGGLRSNLSLEKSGKAGGPTLRLRWHLSRPWQTSPVPGRVEGLGGNKCPR